MQRLYFCSMKITYYLLGLVLAMSQGNLVHAKETSDSTQKEKRFEVHGTLRGKYEYQPEINESRFQVRNARVSIEGQVIKAIGYKAEIDLSDQGQMRMLDAYVKVTPVKNLDFQIGQMRVPFSIDAHRSPHVQYFANRSFIAKQVGDVRDVGAMLAYDIKPARMKLSAGIFNGAGLTEQKEWHKNVNYSAKMEWNFAPNFNLELSSQTVCPDSTRIWLYDGGINFDNGRWHAEAEYLYKHYTDHAFDDVHAFNTFVTYTQPVRRILKGIQFLLRYDFMTDHSDGTVYQTTPGKEHLLAITDYQRGRLTGGVTLIPQKIQNTAIRLNYEKYFYRNSGIPKESEQDKVVVEFMVHF